MFIIVDEGVYVYYVEGCIVFVYMINLFYSVVVEIIIKKDVYCCYIII